MTQIPGDLHITYQFQYRKCGKPSCSTCRSGQGHGPYWYAYWREGSRLRSGYVGKVHPDGEAKALAVARLSEDLLPPGAPLEEPIRSIPRVREVERPRRVEVRPKVGAAIEESAAILA